VLLGADRRCGLEYLALDDNDREIANQVLSRVSKMRSNEIEFMAHQIARATWGK
jgi:hypothetical protein